MGVRGIVSVAEEVSTYISRSDSIVWPSSGLEIYEAYEAYRNSIFQELLYRPSICPGKYMFKAPLANQAFALRARADWILFCHCMSSAADPD
jgi:hypothetical protein